VVEKLNGTAAIRPQALAPSSGQSRKCEPGWLLTKMQMLFSSYRLDQYPDPKAFTAQIGMVLEQYDPQVVAIATSPLTGIQRVCKFPPSIAELVEFCDKTRSEIAETGRRRALANAAPVRVEHRPIDPDQSYEAMFKKYGRPIGFFER
jgi:hypothetical protein